MAAHLTFNFCNTGTLYCLKSFVIEQSESHHGANGDETCMIRGLVVLAVGLKSVITTELFANHCSKFSSELKAEGATSAMHSYIMHGAIPAQREMPHTFVEAQTLNSQALSRLSCLAIWHFQWKPL